MKLPNKIQYGLKIALSVARCPNSDEPVAISDIALVQGIPFNYTSLLARRLKTAGILKSHRGAQGGYSLARAPEEITVTEIFEALDDFHGFLPDSDMVNNDTPAPDLLFWRYLDRSVRNAMDVVTLGALLEVQSEHDVAALVQGADN